LSRTAIRDNSDNVTSAQIEQLDTEISQLTFADKRKYPPASPDGFEQLYGVPNCMVNSKRPNFPREFKEVRSDNLSQPAVVVELPTDGWVPNWRELVKGQDLSCFNNEQEILRACYGTGYTPEIAEHVDLKTWTFLGKSQKGAWAGRIQKLNEDKRAEERRIANLQSASSSSN
jgi:hypothetical protein